MTPVRSAIDAAHSRIILGTWRLAQWGMSPAALAEFFTACADLGISALDAADIYCDYSCERAIGDALARVPGLRHRFKLITKCDIRLTAPHRPEVTVKHYDTSRSYLTGQVEHSLKALRADRIDLLLLHRPDPLMDVDEVAETFSALKQGGKVASFGVSNFQPYQLELLQSRLPFPLVANQIECSLRHPVPLFDGTLDQCQKMRMMSMAWSPLGGGQVLKPEPGASRAVLDTLTALGRDTGLAPDQLALAWLMRHPAGIHPVLGSGKIERVRAALAATQVALDRQHWFRLLEAATGHPVA